MSRIALCAPEALSSVRGNNTTVLRLARGLRARGHEVLEVGEADRALREPATLDLARGCDLLHAFHAFKTGVRVREAARRLGLPYVVSLTGTDLHEDLHRPERRDAVIDVLRGASALLLAHAGAAAAISSVAPDTTRVVVPKGVELPAAASLAVEETDGELLFLHVGGWREVKNNLLALEPLARLRGELPGVRLRFIGPALDPAYHQRWLRERARFPFAADGGVVALGSMSAEYAAAAVVLNTSHAEGGANAVLEAMAHGRAVLASRIPGNEAYLHHDAARPELSTGFLYDAPLEPGGAAPERRRHDAADLLEKARALAASPTLRRAIGRNARDHVAREHSPVRELDQVIAAYRLAGAS